jgi:hypothetical protein
MMTRNAARRVANAARYTVALAAILITAACVVRARPVAGVSARVRLAPVVVAPAPVVVATPAPAPPPPPPPQPVYAPPPQPVGYAPPPPQTGPIEAGCSFNAGQLRGEIGSIFQIACPPGCQHRGGLWGTDVYTFDSAICRAGIHVGVASDAAGGVVTVRLDPGRPAYRGSIRNGLRSSDYGAYRASFTVLLPEGFVPAAIPPPPPPQIIEAGCSFSADSIRGEVGSAHVVSCPPGCGRQFVVGTDVYPSRISVCAAAIHAGFATPQSGGSFTVVLEPGRPAYRGSIRNGVRSHDSAQHRQSFRIQPR